MLVATYFLMYQIKFVSLQAENMWNSYLHLVTNGDHHQSVTNHAYSTIESSLSIDCGALKFPGWGIATNHWGITTRSKATTGVFLQLSLVVIPQSDSLILPRTGIQLYLLVSLLFIFIV